MAIHDSNTGAKGTLYRGNYEPAEWFVGNKKITGYKETEKTGTSLTFNDTYNDKVLAAKVKGDSVQKSEWRKAEAESSQVQTVQGKNLFDGVVDEANGYYNTDGTFSSNSGYDVYRISVVAGQTYTKSGSLEGINTFWDGATYISSTNSATIVVPAGATSVKVSVRKVNITANNQIELGSTPTSYEPFVPDSPSPDYPQPITTTIPAGTYKTQDWRGDWYEFTLTEDLHGIGDVRDSVEWDKYSHDGFLRGGMGAKVFDGTEYWNITNNCFRFTITSSPVKHNSITGFCTHYKQGTVLGLWDNTMDMAFVLGSGYFGQLGVAHTAIRDSRFSDIPAFKAELANQYAANTPVTMYFQLATPTRTPLTFTLNNASTAPELPLDFLTDTPSADYPATIFSAEGEVTVKNSGGTELQSTSFPTLRSINDIKDEFDVLTGKTIRKTARIESYAGEAVGTNYISSTGSLDTGATVIYELETPVIEQLEPTELKTYPHTTIAEVHNDTAAKAEITATVKTVDLN